MKALSGLDGAFLHLETPETPMHVGSLSVFELPPRQRGDFATQVRRQIAERLPAIPVFRRRLAEMPLHFANPVWVEDGPVDLDYHVEHLTLPPPGSLEQLEDQVAELHGELMDRSRPLWRLYVIDGMPDRQVGYYLKVHHAVLDGQAGILLAKTLWDPTPRARAPKAVAGALRRRTEHPGLLQLAAAALRHDAGQVVRLVRHLPEVVGTLAGMIGGALAAPRAGARREAVAFGPHTALNVPITGERGFASCTLPLDALKAIAHAHEAKLNDVVLALCAGALRRYLAHHGGIPRKPLIAAVPVSLRAAGDTEMTTQATMTLMNLHTDVADPIRRLHAIRDSANAAKAFTGRTRNIMPTDFPTIAAPWLMHGLATLYGRSGLAGAVPPLANIVVSNIPGPTVPLYTAGARMVRYIPISIPEHGLAVNLTVISYAGSVGFGFIAARNAVPDARRLTQAVQQAYSELAKRTALRSTSKKPAPRAAPRKVAGAAHPLAGPRVRLPKPAPRARPSAPVRA